jgi:hypothetical protein
MAAGQGRKKSRLFIIWRLAARNQIITDSYQRAMMSHNMQPAASMTDRKIPDYDLHMPKSLPYPLRVGVLKPGGSMAIYDEPSTIFNSVKLMRKYGLQIENKTMDMVFGVKL